MASLVEICRKWGLFKPALEAQKEIKHPNNVPGKYWVDCNSCSSFGICVDTAPNNFRYPLEQNGKKEGYRNETYVYKQPETEEEEAQCRLAMEICPVDAIHDNGVSGLPDDPRVWPPAPT